MQRDHLLQLEMATSRVTDDTALGWGPVDTQVQAWLRQHGQYIAPAGEGPPRALLTMKAAAASVAFIAGQRKSFRLACAKEDANTACNIL